MAERATPPAGEEDLVQALRVAGGHFQAGRLGEAKALYEGILRRHPGSAAALHFLGLIAHNQGDPDRAIDLLERAVAQTGTVPFFHGNLGEVYRSLGRYADAAASCRKALELYPVYPEALNTLGAALVELGDLEEAGTTLKRAIEFKPDLAVAHANLGNLWSARGAAEKAVGAYRRALQADPRLVPAYAALGRELRRLGRWEEAEAGYRRALDLAPNDAVIWCALGLGLSDAGRLDEALAALERATGLNPGYSDAHTNKGNLLLNLGRTDEALDAYRRAIDADPGSAEARCSHGFALERLHRLDEARSAAAAALERAPRYPRAELLLARLDRRGGSFAAARQRLEPLLRRDLEPPVRARAAVELGHTLDRLGEYPAAFAAFEEGQAAFAEGEARSVDRDAFTATLEKSLRWFTKDRCASWAEGAPHDGLPSPIFLVGFPRSGTTLVEQILASCPNVATSDEAPIIRTLVRNLPEVLGRAADYPEALGDLTAAEISALRALYWEKAGRVADLEVPGLRFVDKNPLNIAYLGFAHRMFPDAKVLVALRDPRDACLSCFFQAFLPNEGTVHFLRLEDTARMYRTVMELWSRYRTALNLDHTEVRYEDLVANPEETIGTILTFLGLEGSDRTAEYRDRARRRYIATPSYQGVAEPIYDRSVGRWRNYRSRLEPVLHTLQPFVEELGYA